ncbi:Phosphatidylglycerol--prolipoprotein diacylglyceryl transferase [Frankliniella fusca]|uniref:Phosphatidylglycerol--prolipoprotein diacylglyceryl transferase n=1 Tax=Frankliniella fusca TaxID=407009 RepID=A0AAE1GQ10_9NEOP|nr:Phosphatidylglycerol--prolipoprotein diacylglyceryl transferase [Frankliniella fusca]
MESFFDSFNNAQVNKSPTYRPNSEVARYRLLKLLKIEPAVTTVGPTYKLTCEVDAEVQIFYYLNKTDALKVASKDCDGLNGLIARGESPYVFMVQTRNMLRTVFLPYSHQYSDFFSKKQQVPKSMIPLNVQAEMDFGVLAQNGVIFEDAL